MLRVRHLYIVLLLFTLAACEGGVYERSEFAPAPESSVDNNVNGTIFTSGNWEPHLPAGERGRSAGNHRAVVTIDSMQTTKPAVVARIEWRRPDKSPEDKALIVFDAATMDTIKNVFVLGIDNHAGTVAFEPRAESDTYLVYYMPYQTTGGYYPKVSYLEGGNSEAGEDWFSSLDNSAELRALAGEEQVNAREIQSVNDFHSFFPMEVAATEDEVDELLSVEERDFYYFPEDRSRPIRMRNMLPYHWASRDLQPLFSGTARRGEYYTFQIGIYSPDKSLDDVTVEFRDLLVDDDVSIPKTEMTCFNCEGVDLHGNPFTKEVNVDAGTVQALWFGVQIPDDAEVGTHSSVLTIGATNAEPQMIPVRINVVRDAVDNNGDDQPENMTRLAWLNSTMGRDPDFIIEPFIPVAVDNNTIRILGRDIKLGPTGLPDSIRSYYSPDVTGITDTAQDILSAPISIVVRTGSGTEQWRSSEFEINQPHRGAASWRVENESRSFTMLLDGTVEYDGMLEYELQLIAKADLSVEDIEVPVVMEPAAATYILGLGHKGQRRPDRVDWKWKVENHQEGVWLGGINKGLQYVLRDDNYERPLNTNFYRNKPLNLPPSWYNEGRGGIIIENSGRNVTATNYSGSRSVAAGDTLNFNIRFLITPFKPIDTEAHFNTRFVHKYVPVDTVKAWGGTVANIHHANEINPYINYPFFNLDKQSAYIREAHRKSVKVKLYNTIRELTYKSHELFAMRSLGDEIFNDGEGGGHSWLQEHLRDHYHSAWHAYRVDDAAILNKGTSRWTNYYIEGLNWLAKNQEIDGLYLDDIAFSRETVKRMVSVLHRHRDEVIIDLHSANQFNVRDGFINSAMLYMEHFPFISRLWFGEYFEYDLAPDYWMTEVSGLPFGL
ncbi:MAG: hypothetical protein HKN43_01045, partial [Rhodothermales bacterium]|nr:hypothetical protein [Rhodothermales bacterium]